MSSVRFLRLEGGVFDERKRLRGSNGQYRTVSPEQKTLAKVIGNVKFNASITRPGIKTELYANLHAAFGLAPTKKLKKGKKAHGVSFADLLCKMLRLVRTDDGHTFEVNEATESKYTISKVVRTFVVTVGCVVSSSGCLSVIENERGRLLIVGYFVLYSFHFSS